MLADEHGVNRDDVFVFVKELRFVSGTWEMKSATDDPQIYLYRDLDAPFAAGEWTYLVFSLYVDRQCEGQLIWWLSDGRWETSVNLQFDKGWHEYCLDMRSLLNQGTELGSGIVWEGMINRLRLDPGEEPGLTIKIKDVSLRPRTKKKLTVIFETFKSLHANLKANLEELKNLPNEVTGKPALVYAEISTKCNLRCRMCGRYAYAIPASQEGFMSREVFEKMSALFSPGSQLALFGRGESLLHPDFLYFLELGLKKRMRLGFNTNGLLLTAQMAQSMVELKQTHITFSCSAGSPEAYLKVHGTNGWDILWKNIDMLNEAKRKRYETGGKNGIRDSFPVIYIEFVSQLSNVRELASLVQRAFEHDIRGLMVVDMTAHTDEMEKERMNIPENIPLAEECYQEARSVCDALVKQAGREFDLRLPGSFSPVTKKFQTEAEKRVVAEFKEKAGQEDGASGDHFCSEPWRTFFVRFDGTVGPCCITARVLGDLKKNSAEEIWNGPGYKEFRKNMKGAAKPYECLHCHLFPGAHRYDTNLNDQSTYTK